jgi:hypothetical protein
MEKEIYTFKNKIKEVINEEEMKVWLAQKYSKRAEYIFKIGEEQFLPPQEIAKNNNYVLFGQNIEDNEMQVLKKTFIKYFS